ncbi:MAG: hypothetical protein RIR25_425 [Verrucomicrobiota bacterium]
MRALAWLAAIVAVGSLFLAISPVLVAAIGNDEDFINAGWALLFCTFPAAVPGYGIATLLAVVACGLAMTRGEKRTGIAGIVALASPPFVVIGSDLLPSNLCSWGELFLPIGLVLAFIAYVAGLITAIVAAHRANPRLTASAPSSGR